jgi:hypothetical protein
MAKKCLNLLLAGALLQMPVLARADTPEERVQKLEKELEKSKKEIEKLKEERDQLVRDQEKREKLLKELVLDPELRKKIGLPPKSLEQRQWEKAKNELERLQEERDRLAKEKEERDKRIKRLMEDVERLAKENRLPSPGLPGQLLWDPPPLPELNIPKPSPNEREGVVGGVIKGTITGVAENLATISIGSDQGVKVDQIFHVYRLEPDPAYLGTLKITNVETRRAAGRFAPATKNATVKTGDTVDSKVTRTEENNDRDEPPLQHQKEPDAATLSRFHATLRDMCISKAVTIHYDGPLARTLKSVEERGERGFRYDERECYSWSVVYHREEDNDNTGFILFHFSVSCRDDRNASYSCEIKKQQLYITIKGVDPTSGTILAAARYPQISEWTISDFAKNVPWVKKKSE